MPRAHSTARQKRAKASLETPGGQPITRFGLLTTTLPFQIEDELDERRVQGLDLPPAGSLQGFDYSASLTWRWRTPTATS